MEAVFLFLVFFFFVLVFGGGGDVGSYVELPTPYENTWHGSEQCCRAFAFPN